MSVAAFGTIFRLISGFSEFFSNRRLQMSKYFRVALVIQWCLCSVRYLLICNPTFLSISGSSRFWGVPSIGCRQHSRRAERKPAATELWGAASW